MTTVSLPSTFVASASPTSNFSGAAVIYVGTVPGLGNCIGLLQIPTLPLPPTGQTLLSAVLQLGVNTKFGPSPSTVNVQKVTAPSPLNTTAVTFNTPVTIDSVIQASKSIASTDVGNTVQIELTALISSWYTTPFPGLALTCTDGSFVLFDSINSPDPAKVPQLILTFSGGPTPPLDVNATIVGHQVITAAESVTAPSTPNATSTPRDISQFTKANFLVTNTGTFPTFVGVQESIDGTNYTAQPQIIVNPGVTSVLSPNYAKFARLYYSTGVGTNDLLINYIGQT